MPKRVTVRTEAELILPDGADVRQYEGVGTGVEIEMPGGEILKPWTTIESESEGKDLTESELMARDIHLQHLNREIVANIEFVED